MALSLLQIATTLGSQHGEEEANNLAKTDPDALASASLPGNDWGTSSSEAWYFARRDNDLPNEDEVRLSYCAAYEAAARRLCAALAAEIARDAARAEEEDEEDEDEDEEDPTWGGIEDWVELDAAERTARESALSDEIRENGATVLRWWIGTDGSVYDRVEVRGADGCRYVVLDLGAGPGEWHPVA